jgi:hypothetical protein
VHSYVYDADNRLKEVYTSTDGLNWDKDNKYFYYQHGSLARTETGEKQVQGRDMAYTIQGWVKGVNSELLSAYNDMGRDGDELSTIQNEYVSYQPNMHANFAKDAHGFTLNYFKNAATFEQDYSSIRGLPAQALFSMDKNTLNGGVSSFNLNTNNGNGPSLYNGNISSMVTSIVNLDNTSANYLKALPQLSAYRYDQLQRLKQMTVYKDIQLDANGAYANAWQMVNTGNPYSDYKMNMNYDANGNITTLVRNGTQVSGTLMDNLSYTYDEQSGITARKTNRLIGVRDAVGANAYPTDIDDQGQANAADLTKQSWNYDYDATGNLIRDKGEHIGVIEWTTDRKVSKVLRDGTPKIVNGQPVYMPDVEFEYNAMRQRVMKVVIPNDANGRKGLQHWTYTYYVHDASGNVAAVYTKKYEPIVGSTTDFTEVFKLEELDIYGNARIGLLNTEKEYRRTVTITSGGGGEQSIVAAPQAAAAAIPTTPNPNVGVVYENVVGDKKYEFTNHLGNVLSVTSDKKIPEVKSTLNLKVDFETGEYSTTNTQGATSGAYAQELGTNNVYSSTMLQDVNGGTSVIAKVQAKNLNGVNVGALVLGFRDKVTNANVGYFSTPITGNNANYNLFTVSGTVPSGVTNPVEMGVYVWNPSASALIYIDDLECSVTLGNGQSVITGYRADYVSSTDYYAFNMPMQSRTWNRSSYRYNGVNGQEQQDEIFEGASSAEYWMYDSRLGRRWERDPIIKDWESPYATFGNNPIVFSDVKGLDKNDEVTMVWNTNTGKYDEKSRDKSRFGPYVTLIHYVGGVDDGVNKVISQNGVWSNGGKPIVNKDKYISDQLGFNITKTKTTLELNAYGAKYTGETYFGDRKYGETGFKLNHGYGVGTVTLNHGKMVGKYSKQGFDESGKVVGANGNVGLEYGVDKDFNLGVNINLEVLTALFSTRTGIMNGENGWIGLAGGGEASAAAIGIEGSSCTNLYGTCLTISTAGYIANAAKGISGGILCNPETKTIRIYGLERLGVLPFGERISVSFEINIPKFMTYINSVLKQKAK